MLQIKSNSDEDEEQISMLSEFKITDFLNLWFFSSFILSHDVLCVCSHSNFHHQDNLLSSSCAETIFMFLPWIASLIVNPLIFCFFSKCFLFAQYLLDIFQFFRHYWFSSKTFYYLCRYLVSGDSHVILSILKVVLKLFSV